MAQVLPFRGIRFDPAKVGDLATVMCPPYDVVNEEERRRLVSLSPWNLIRVELPQEKPSQPATDEEYAAAAKLLRSWEKEQVLVRDEHPALYRYHQGYTGPDGKKRERKGFLCALRVEDYTSGSVRPHEKTLPKPKEDRYKLLMATATNVSPVFGLYDDKEGKVAEALARRPHLDGESREFAARPLAEFTDSKGIEHRVWRVADSESIGAVREGLSGSRIYIADGHHRYETAIRYRNFRREQSALHRQPGMASYDFCLAYLADVHDSGLAVFPIHRLAKIPAGMDAAALKASLERLYTVEVLPGIDTNGEPKALAVELEAALGEASKREKVFVLYSKSHGIAWRIRAATEALAATMLQAGVSKPVAALDVTALHRTILEDTLHASYAEGTLHFAHGIEDAVEIAQGKGTGAGDAGGFDLAILCHPTKVSELLAVVDAGETMPQKSTFFYPKPASGIVMNRIDG